ncbi:HD domain-containing protein [Salisediminibacterium halotolerans]|uniref:HD domain-containing protein n=1 Tax=Salisediminibacterium halotolerans TaxID=517425 RepID=UPI000EB0711A|nr:HD domain-containing protein [Salisediminibacterium halotolerans]RLJ74089.1 uncharacterized protein BCL39_1374 [Actinophytocola xinjiangensis]RPE87818.1 uncharacterized protein EDD67_1557 [Salisediminibacterium halotolerans]TWG34926.1 uncharacterized protein BCL52_1371 [Salisediminibacterium halotolerans]GEL07887.1 phosphohydrolase [Salisediminibacterium halotolerans]
MHVLIDRAEQLARRFFTEDASGHDWHHTDRVRRQAVKLAEREGADRNICEIAALLHDVADEKFYNEKGAGIKRVEHFLADANTDSETVCHILAVIDTVSFKGGNNQSPDTLEAKVVQDADRLDAIGAIGTARCFMFAGNRGEAMYVPDASARTNMSEDEYRRNSISAIHHFYEKLLYLKDHMKTESGFEIAEERHRFLEVFLEQFFSEWDGAK